VGIGGDHERGTRLGFPHFSTCDDSTERIPVMAEFRYRFRPELVAPSAWIAAGAVVLGDVHLGEYSSVWCQAVVRGDTAPISIGERTNIQDLCMLHADPGFPCQLGNRVTVGHGAIVHGAIIDDDVMLGMRCVILNGARIGSGSLVGAGAVVTEGTDIPPHSVVMGMPARVVRSAEPRDVERIRHAAEHYVAAAAQFARESASTTSDA
jgi:carbonic anhydrase/acetyltransferase-like protein (isoleucine patch superfamily)